MAKNDDEYHRLEGKKEGKGRIKRLWGWSLIFAYATASFMLLYIFVPDGLDVTSQMFISDFSSGDKFFKYSVYYPFAILASLIIWMVVIPRSYASELSFIQAKAAKDKREITWYEKKKLKVALIMDKTLFIGLYPISMLFLTALKDGPERSMYYLRYGWIDHLEKRFFKQSVEKEDGYERAKSIFLFQNYPEILTGKRGEEAATSKEFSFLLWLFKGKKGLEDVILISEGYLSIKESPKYDRLISRREFNHKMKKAGKNRERGLDSFRMFNGSDEILFSEDVIRELIRQESDKFKDYIDKYALNSRTLFSRRFTVYSAALMNDRNIKRYLFASKAQADILMADPEKFSKHLSFVLVMYFRIVLFKILIGQYINLPAGTTVVRIRDYTLRMIIESFDDECLIETTYGKNDGSTRNFNSDNLVNIFLAAFNHYKKGVENSFDKRIFNIFNFRDERMTEQKEEEDTVNFSKEISASASILKQDEPDEWLSRLKEDLIRA